MKEYIMIKETGNSPITVAELIRCKDCKYWSPIMLGGCGYCNLTDENYIEKADGYCCHAEKRK